MTVTHSEEWHDQRTVAAKVKELDERVEVHNERLMRLEDWRTSIGLETPQTHLSADQITVTDAMAQEALNVYSAARGKGLERMKAALRVILEARDGTE